MNAINTTLEFLVVILGWLLLVIMLIGGIAAIIWGSIQAIQNFINVRYEDARRAARQDICNRMMSDSWWFSEDRATMWLLQQIAGDINEAGWSDISKRRDEWRKEREKKEKNDERN